ncbi:hypothetical protein VP01_2222g5 [Puccinia sorghi]|uniref:Uncharacterized protein n=1 Tax=Puccinia sorghi TaxID=27349 RepID=A0A0L6VAL7_9BASI|nr:hypothetical protein VP01_2222g5 [Puccinia sorghi]
MLARTPQTNPLFTPHSVFPPHHLRHYRKLASSFPSPIKSPHRSCFNQHINFQLLFLLVWKSHWHAVDHQISHFHEGTGKDSIQTSTNIPRIFFLPPQNEHGNLEPKIFHSQWCLDYNLEFPKS